MTRFLFFIVVLGLLVAGGFWLDARSKPLVQPARSAARTTRPTAIHAAGVVEGIGHQLNLRLEIAGRITEVLVREGDVVQAAQTLIKLDDATQKHQVEVLRGELQYSEARLARLKNGAHEQERFEARANHASRVAKLKHAQHELERSGRLVTKNAVGEQEVDRWKAEVDALTADVSAAQARLDLLEAPARDDELQAAQAQVTVANAKLLLAQTELARTELKAPSAGQILEVNREPGELVELQNQQPAIVMADTSRLRVRAYVEELDAVVVRPGMQAKITADGLPDRVIEGEVVEVMPRMSFKQVWTDRPDERFDVKTREVLIDLKPADAKLVYGLPVEVEIEPAPSAVHQHAMHLTR